MCALTADVKGDHHGQTPLDVALDSIMGGCVKVALYLIHCGCGGDKERIRLLCNASRFGKLDVVKELVEQHKVDPSESVSAVYTIL